MPAPKVLSQQALEGLRAYRYKPGGYTWLDHLHTPFWNWLTERLPMWLAPNLITLTGLIGLLLAYFTMWAYKPEFTGDAPPWVYYLSAASIVIYTNLDCIDGKQARRTKSSSPLGQLFDHGCDALALHVQLNLVQAALDHPNNTTSSLTLNAINFPWMLSHLEEYHTGTLMYGDGYFGILEANYILASVIFVTGLTGVGMWARPIGELVTAWPAWAKPETQLKHVFCVVAQLGGTYLLVGILWRMFRAKADVLSPMERGHKELGMAARIRHTAVCLILVVLGAVWIGDSRAKPLEARLDALSFGLAYAIVATQLIMDHMCKEPFRPPLFAVGVLAAGCANSVYQLADGRAAALASTAALLVYYLWYVITIVEQVCAFLGIRCLRIKHKESAQ